MTMRAYAIAAAAMGLSDLIHSESDSTYTTSRLTLKGGVGTAREVSLGQLAAIVDRGTAAVTPTADAGNTGNGSIGTVTADAGAQEGVWNVVIIEPASNAGEFEVTRPDGTVDGTGTVAVAYNGGINFTLADGATDFAAGDRWTIGVNFPDDDGKAVAWDPAGTDGSQFIAGVFLENAVADVGVDGKVNVLARGRAILRRENIVWPDGATADQKAAAYQALKALGIEPRVSG
ncbi:head decoration protein [Brevundimonas sp.]|uniref:head decoration protein n=1 Tax=Brevundimonas sp. TaxID=1871086 RepID=UPI002D581243|nr:head decoration protein [Brevundimonas sp.]HYD26976.1 head decoration protein [Brevundimonas sp.]